MLLKKYNENIIETFVINNAPIGEGFVIEQNVEDYEDLIEMYDEQFEHFNCEDYVIIKYFNNDLPYYHADSSVIIVRKDLKILFTGETSVINFSDYEVFLLNGESIAEKINELNTKEIECLSI